MVKPRASCELCHAEAALYCPFDSAFLCWNCDSTVHQANFLVARHVRCTLCSHCKGLTNYRVSGVGFRPLLRPCRSCLRPSQGRHLGSLSSSSFSDCISTAESCATSPKKVDADRPKADNNKVGSSSSVTELSAKQSKFSMRSSVEVLTRTTETKTPGISMRSQPCPAVDSKAEGILVNWCRKLGLSGVISSAVVPFAIQGLRICVDELFPVPSFRVLLAASLWFSLRLRGDRSLSTWHALKRLEQISGVPGKLLLASESKLWRMFRRRNSDSHQLEEGWAESSV
ncbi:B-box zinc finger protein 32 [Diospyros lotus]|uniref:B-box zinc finger protein 32 n=1 Tax=Diospyros lotus TaxID=55363 RepID=UPI002255E484|nr:B-box zinc finger protein 32 [Diospyros lotus]